MSIPQGEATPLGDFSLEFIMQLKDLVKRVEDMTDEELREHVRALRHSRTVTRAAHKKHKEKPAKQAHKVKENKLDKLIADMSPDQVKQLLLQLGEG